MTKLYLILIGLLLSSVACLVGNRATAIPPQRPVNFDVQTATPTPKYATLESEAVEPTAVVILPLEDVPTHTPDPNAPPPTQPPPTPLPPTAAIITPTVETTPSLAIDVAPTLESQQATPSTCTDCVQPEPEPVELDPPLQGGEWDFEAGFIPWPNPYGEPCPGAAVAAGWTAFVEEGQYGSSCLNENLYPPNVQSGVKSQEITFDFIAANSGVFRTIATKPNHRYKIEAFAKHDRSISPVQMALGIDRTGGVDWRAESVEWFPWDNAAEDTWVATEETITATGEQLTIFIKGQHLMADQGGKTVIDNVRITHLGP